MVSCLNPTLILFRSLVTYLQNYRNVFWICLMMSLCEGLHMPCRCVLAHPLHAGCWKSAGGNTFMIKFSQPDIFASQPSEWFHMCFLQSQNSLVIDRMVIFWQYEVLFCHQGGDVILTVWIASKYSWEERCFTTWFKIYFGSHNSDLRKKNYTIAEWISDFHGWFVPTLLFRMSRTKTTLKDFKSHIE